MTLSLKIMKTNTDQSLGFHADEGPDLHNEINLQTRISNRCNVKQKKKHNIFEQGAVSAPVVQPFGEFVLD